MPAIARAHGGKRPLPVVVGRQLSGPGVEELDGLRRPTRSGRTGRPRRRRPSRSRSRRSVDGSRLIICFDDGEATSSPRPRPGRTPASTERRQKPRTAARSPTSSARRRKDLARERDPLGRDRSACRRADVGRTSARVREATDRRRRTRRARPSPRRERGCRRRRSPPSGANRRKGWSDTSAARSARPAELQERDLLAHLRYSGRYRPACRIIQTGGRSTAGRAGVEKRPLTTTIAMHRGNDNSRSGFAERGGSPVGGAARVHPSEPQLPQDVGQDAAVLVVVDLDRRVDADAGARTLCVDSVLAADRQSTLLARSEMPAREAHEIVEGLACRRASASPRSSLRETGSGSTPMPTRLERWMRSKLCATTAFTPSRLRALGRPVARAAGAVFLAGEDRRADVLAAWYCIAAS